MTEEELKEEIYILKNKLFHLEAQLHTMYGFLAADKIIDDKKFQEEVAEMEEYMRKDEEETKYMDSEGYVEVKVKCAKCGKEYEEMVSKARKEFALKHDTFFCEICHGG